MLELMLIALPFLLIFAIGYMGDLKERQGGVTTNCDDKGQIFTYIVPQNEMEILAELEFGGKYTDMKYRYDAAQCCVIFHEPGMPAVTYELRFRRVPEGTAMRVKQLDHLRTVVGAPGHEYRRGGNRYAWLQNEFWQQKLNAEPLKYQPDMWR